MSFEPEVEAYFKTAQIYGTIAGLFMIGASAFLAMNSGMIVAALNALDNPLICAMGTSLTEGMVAVNKLVYFLFMTAIGFGLSAVLMAATAHYMLRTACRRMHGVIHYGLYVMPLAIAVYVALKESFG